MRKGRIAVRRDYFDMATYTCALSPADPWKDTRRFGGLDQDRDG